MKFSDRLKEQRLLRGYSQEYIAKYMQVSQVTVSNWERGIKEPNFQVLIDLCNLFEKTSDYMVGIEE